jgi:hypothetical protein
MINIMVPLLAVLAIVVPLVVAYVIVLMQSRRPTCSCRKELVSTVADPLQSREEFSHAEEKYGVRYCCVREWF